MLQLFIRRIIRGIKFIPTFIYESATVETESCLRCGRCYLSYTILPDKKWGEIFSEKEDGCYCPDCIIKIATKKGVKINQMLHGYIQELQEEE
jgi:hypothetical protein